MAEKYYWLRSTNSHVLVRKVTTRRPEIGETDTGGFSMLEGVSFNEFLSVRLCSRLATVLLFVR